MVSVFIKRIGNSIIPVAIVLLVLLEVYSPSAYLQGIRVSPARDILFLITLLLMMSVMSNNQWLEGRSLLQKLRIVCGGIFIIWGGLRILDRFGATPIDELGLPFVPSNVPAFQHAVWISLLVGVIWLSIFVLYTVKSLIFVQQGKHTERHFRIFLLFVFLGMIYLIISGDDELIGGIDRFEWSEIVSDAGIFTVMILISSVINGFRCKWIHYLNKGQKIGLFFILALVILFTQMFAGGALDTVRNYSPAVFLFLSSVINFYTIYLIMAFLGLMFLLPSAGILDRRIHEVKSLQSLTTTLASVFDFEDLIEKSCQMAVKVVHADAAWIELLSGDRMALQGTCKITKKDVEALPRTVVETLRKEVLEQGVLRINHVARNKKTQGLRKLKGRAGSLLAARISSKEKTMGILYAVRNDAFGFMDESKDMFQSFADQVALALENVQLVKVTIEQEVYRNELIMAHESQMRLLPQIMPNIPGLEIEGYCVTANEIGGDFYDLIEVGKDRLDIAVGDVSGKGASAAFYMAELKGVIQALAPHFSSPKQIMKEINTFVLKHFETDIFVTMVYGVYIPSKRKLTVARAGHPPIGLSRHGESKWIESDGIGLGLAEDALFAKRLKEMVLTLQKGDQVLFLTDGVLEARNSAGEEYGAERISTILEARAQGAAALVDSMREDLEKFIGDLPKHDDITLVAMHVREKRSTKKEKDA